MLNIGRIFKKYINKKIALYGLGTETERILPALINNFKIIGLLDGFKEEGELYGKPIISLAQAVEAQVELIIVVARPGSCRVIAKRIGDTCKENGIELIDVRGKDLLETCHVQYELKGITGVTKAELLEKIESAEAVSFDLFDTLIMRQTLEATDVFEHINYVLSEKDIYIEDFCKKRLESEKMLSKNKAPTLLEIYEDVINKSNMVDIAAHELVEIEWNIDYELIVPRRDVCSVFQNVYASGKPIYIISDTYYNKKQLEKIVKKCGITEYTDILASSDYQTGKTQNLFCIYKQKEFGKKCLHIGDDVVADVQSASACGIETCRLYSGLDLLESMGYLGLSQYGDTLTERLKIGMFVSNMFNSPFLFETESRKLKVNKAYDIGYQLCAPIIADFVIWFNDQVQKNGIRNIWFGARDGYLIQKMFHELNKLSKSEYFFTSRLAAIRAGVEDEEDISYVDSMKFSGSSEENLAVRFGIDAKKVVEEDISPEKNGLFRYKNAILKKSHIESSNYKKYINKLDVQAGDIAFFDFVAKGTCQMYIQKLIDSHIKGLYFLQLEPEFMMDKGLDIVPFYTKDEKDSTEIYEDYYILETILTAPHPSIHGFSEDGAPIYTEETRSNSDMECFMAIQEGVLDYFRTYIKLCPKKELAINKRVDEILLSLLHHVEILDEEFNKLKVEDPFFNRMTNVVDLL